VNIDPSLPPLVGSNFKLTLRLFHFHHAVTANPERYLLWKPPGAKDREEKAQPTSATRRLAP
jgi:hypothetical protein